MNNAVFRILEIEKAAKSLVDTSLSERECLEITIEKEKKEIEEKYLAICADRIAEFQGSQKEAFDSEIERLEKNYAVKSKKLTEQYETNKDLWIEDIYNKVIGR